MGVSLEKIPGLGKYLPCQIAKIQYFWFHSSDLQYISQNFIPPCIFIIDHVNFLGFLLPYRCKVSIETWKVTLYKIWPGLMHISRKDNRIPFYVLKCVMGALCHSLGTNTSKETIDSMTVTRAAIVGTMARFFPWCTAHIWPICRFDTNMAMVRNVRLGVCHRFALCNHCKKQNHE